MLKWLRNARDQKATVKGHLLMAKSDQFASRLDITDVSGKIGELTRFKDSNDVLI